MSVSGRRHADIMAFVRESSLIEGISGDPLPCEIEAHEQFLMLPEIEVDNLAHFVASVQPLAVLRDQVGMDVRVGKHLPMRGGPDVVVALERLLVRVNDGTDNAWFIHVDYERLHPFTDGNGRSGRVLWYWMMLKYMERIAQMGFLQTFYYQTLRAICAIMKIDERDTLHPWG